MELYFVEHTLRGRLAIATRPRGGDWLQDDLKRLGMYRVGLLVSMLTPEESRELQLEEEGRLAADLQLSFLSVPVNDRSLPSQVNEFGLAAKQVASFVDHGGAVAVHCRMGIGRSSLFCGSVLVGLGVAPKDAWNLLEKCRGRAVPDTPEQRAWLFDYHARL